MSGMHVWQWAQRWSAPCGPVAAGTKTHSPPRRAPPWLIMPASAGRPAAAASRSSFTTPVNAPVVRRGFMTGVHEARAVAWRTCDNNVMCPRNADDMGTSSVGRGSMLTERTRRLALQRACTL